MQFICLNGIHPRMLTPVKNTLKYINAAKVVDYDVLKFYETNSSKSLKIILYLFLFSLLKFVAKYFVI